LEALISSAVHVVPQRSLEPPYVKISSEVSQSVPEA
jgi:hypothetical protein